MNMKFAAAFTLVGMFLVVGASAQGKKLTRTEFNKAMDAAFELSDKKNRREVTKSETFENGRKRQTAVQILEYLPPSREHMVFIEGYKSQKSISEWIIVDGQRYAKNHPGDFFKERALTEINPTDPSDADIAIEIKKTKYTSEPSKFAGKAVTIYKRIYTGDPDETTRTSRLILYIGKDGLIIKSEQKSVDVGRGNNQNYSTTYEYDPKGLKIEAPDTF